MGKRGARRQADRFLWGGVAILLLSAGMGIYAAAGEDTATLRTALTAFGLCAGMLLLLLRSHLLAAERAVEILADSVRSRVTERADKPPDEPAKPASPRIPGHLPEERVEQDSPASLLEDRLQQISSAHQDLVAHHRFTKRMLQSLRHEEVLETLLQGIRDGLGFSGALLGIRDPEGILFFRNDPSENGREQISIHSWDERSLLARTFWSGSYLLAPSLREVPHTAEDRLLLGESGSFLIPVYRKGTRKCSEASTCMNVDCPVYGVEGPRCWIEGRPSASASWDPKALQQRRQECARCEMFGGCGVIVVREQRGSRPINRDTTRGIITLVDEASNALQVAELYENARIMSVTDGLTGLTNHREFYTALRRELERARRYSHAVSLLMIDVDNFKEFNDRYGHMEGDRALQTIAGILKRCVRTSDIAARYGGEEFGIILPEATPVGAQILAERIKTEIASQNFLENGSRASQLTVSIGIYTSNDGIESEDLMVGHADEAAYLAKNAGKNQVVVKAHA